MSPLVGAPNRGYADWQRVGNYDSGPLYEDLTNTPISNATTPIIDVSRFEYLAVEDVVTLNACKATITWYADAAGSVQLGQRYVQLSSVIASGAQYHLINLGPFVQITWAPLGGAQWSRFVVVSGSNRYHPLEFTPKNPVLVNQLNVGLAANATAYLYPTDYYAGPLTVWALCFQTYNVWMEVLDTNGNWNLTQRYVTFAAQSEAVSRFMTPPGAWRLAISNGGVATTYYMTATPSTTGST